jgi:hypothetical protein
MLMLGRRRPYTKAVGKGRGGVFLAKARRLEEEQA